MSDRTWFEVRDDDLPERPALARADDYPAALRAVERLQEEFLDSLEANGEGSAGLSLRLRVVELAPNWPPRLRRLTSRGGRR